MVYPRHNLHYTKLPGKGKRLCHINLLKNRPAVYQKLRNITGYDINEDPRIEHGFINKG
jgi:hypothetical protein